MSSPTAMRVDAKDGTVRLLSPGVGLFTCASPTGRVLTPGQVAGELIVLGRAVKLVVPESVTGVVRSKRPERVREPVDYGTVLYELEGLEAAGEVVADAAAPHDVSAGLVLPAPQTGRFWHRASPNAPPFIREGDEVSAGDAVGLIEVMKTFTNVPYRPTASLPERARVTRLLAGDGEDVVEGAPLLEVEPIDG